MAGAKSTTGGSLKASKQAAAGVISQKTILTHRVCAICQNHMRQDEIGVEFSFKHNRAPGEPRKTRIFKHTKNCKAA